MERSAPEKLVKTAHSSSTDRPERDCLAQSLACGHKAACENALMQPSIETLKTAPFEARLLILKENRLK
jgi:hypothetical protein